MPNCYQDFLLPFPTYNLILLPLTPAPNAPSGAADPQSPAVVYLVTCDFLQKALPVSFHLLVSQSTQQSSKPLNSRPLSLTPQYSLLTGREPSLI